MAALSVSNANVRTYSALYRRVKETLLDGQREIEDTKVRTYWLTGRYIQLHVLQNGNRAEYGARAIARLSEDFDVGLSVLKACRTFASRYATPPIGHARGQLQWAHFRELMTITDKTERAKLEEKARASGWSSAELVLQIKASRPEAEYAEVTSPGLSKPEGRVEGPSTVSVALLPLRGELYTYQVFKRKVLSQGATELVLDLGFANYRDVETLDNFKEGDIVESKAKAEGYRLIKGTPSTSSGQGRTAKDLYTYSAVVEKTIDGDTLKVHIDLGFGQWTRQTLRLRSIDCPELGTKAGEAAKAFVQSYLKEASRIIVRSSRSDKWDRYLADVFIPKDGESDRETDIYLNQLLLDTGHAERWEP